MNFATVDQLLDKIGDRINPILVKETRQALKSRQFTSTFMLLLAANLIVSFAGIAFVGPDIDYQSSGSDFFLWYFGVLAFAIFVVVPFGAYRSLAAEQEERTYELLSITTLNPGQIIIGKLLSSMAQMFIYYSAIAPFMAFTYLLKGIDIFSIVFVLVLAILGSAGLSIVGLFLATFASRRGWQVMLSVVMICGLMSCTGGSIGLAAVILYEVGGVMRDPYFWIAMSATATAYVATFALLFQLSVSQLTFEADNRSSKVRIVIVLQTLAALGWIGWGWIRESSGDPDFLMVVIWVAMVYWGFLGACLASEPAGMSRRVARQVPRNAFWRMTTGIFYPGPATGLAFLLVNLLMFVVMINFAEVTEGFTVQNWRGVGRTFSPTAIAAALAAYIFLYVGIGSVLVRLIRRVRPLPMIGGTAIVLILVAIGSLAPNFFVMAFRRQPYDSYSLWQISDPGTTIYEIYRTPSSWALVGMPIGIAGLVLVLNLRAMARAIVEIEDAGRSNLWVVVEPTATTDATMGAVTGVSDPAAAVETNNTTGAVTAVAEPAAGVWP